LEINKLSRDRSDALVKLTSITIRVPKLKTEKTKSLKTTIWIKKRTQGTKTYDNIRRTTNAYDVQDCIAMGVFFLFLKKYKWYTGVQWQKWYVSSMTDTYVVCIPMWVFFLFLFFYLVVLVYEKEFSLLSEHIQPTMIVCIDIVKV